MQTKRQSKEIAINLLQTMNKDTFITLYSRDIKKLRAEMEGYASENAMWAQLPGTTNSAGNLCQHLIGNLRTFVGLALGGYAYTRNREAEFGSRNFSKQQLLAELDQLHDIVIATLETLDDERMHSEYPRQVLDMFPEQSIGLVLTHLVAHLSYHLGQINYHRRWITQMQSAQQ